MKLLIEVVFASELSARAQQDVKLRVQDLREDMTYLGGTVVKADLVAEPKACGTR